ncbi:MAG: peptide synthetase [Micrococcales bacterium]|nr:MAG: peptide synthetase [Micrococcales bacterium]
MTTTVAGAFAVIRHDSGQLSIWPCAEAAPPGWVFSGRPATRSECLAAVERFWTAQGLVGPHPGPPSALPTESLTFPEQFERVVAWRGDAPALVHEDTVISYAEIARRSNRMARFLVAQGVQPEQRVAVSLPRGPALIITALAVLKAGGAYVPIDPAYPTERIRMLLEDSRPCLVLNTTEGGTDAPEIVLNVENAGAELPGGDLPATELNTADRQSALLPAHPMYVIYTSGSTGRPKGVVVSAEGVAALVATQAQTVAAGPGERVLQWASFSFDAAFWDLSLGLLSGATLVTAPEEALLPGPALEATLLRQAITIATLPPVALSATSSARALTGGTLISTGDACTRALAERWAGNRRLFNGYGPTETTVGASIGGPVADGDEPDIGHPFTGYQVHLLDERLQPVPPGEAGDMYLSGPGVARGYLGNPALSAQRFVPDPAGPPGCRMYRSGDRGRRDREGRLHFLGRRDNQVKLRGFRLELPEIEVALAGHPAVDVGAVAVRGSMEDAVLVAFVVPAPGHPVGSRQIRDYLAERLPAHLVPARVVVADTLPTQPNGKLDRAALLDLDHASVSSSGSAPVPPGDWARFCAVVQEVLGSERVQPGDSFFGLGGNSILAGRLAARLRQDLGVGVPVREVFAAATLADLAVTIADLTPSPSTSPPAAPSPLATKV